MRYLTISLLLIIFLIPACIAEQKDKQARGTVSDTQAFEKTKRKYRYKFFKFLASSTTAVCTIVAAFIFLRYQSFNDTINIHSKKTDSEEYNDDSDDISEYSDDPSNSENDTDDSSDGNSTDPKLPVYTLILDKKEDPCECNICFEDFKEGDKIIMFGCGHYVCQDRCEAKIGQGEGKREECHMCYQEIDSISVHTLKIKRNYACKP